jgi:tetratricopeptide (TPR) repeat protein
LSRPFAAPSERPLAIVALAAAAVRLAYLAAHARSPFFTVPVLDARWFHEAASAIAGGVPYAGLATGFRGALYPLLLALPYRLAGDLGIVLAQLAQHAAGVATAVAVAALARTIFGDGRAALAAGLLYAVAPVPLFFEGELLAESLYLLCGVLLLLRIARSTAESPARPLAFASAGALLAVAAQLRPTAWLLLAALPWIGARAGRARRAAALAGSFALATLLLAAAQAPLSAGFRLLPASSGINLYLGNRRGADGLVPRPEVALTHGESYRDSVELYAEVGFAGAGGPGGASARDAFWRDRTLAEWRADPGGRLALLGRKTLVTIWNGEVQNNRDFAFAAREETPLLAWLPARFAPLFALALLGLATAPRSPARDATVAFAALHAAGVVLFFVADRYRLPLYVPLAALAGGGVGALVERAPVATRWRRMALLVAGALLSSVDWSGARRELPGPERDLYFRSIAHAELGDFEAALADARRAASLVPGDAYAHLQAATAAFALDRLDEAEIALAAAARLAPREPRVLNLAGLILERRGDAVRACEQFRRAIEIAPGFEPARRNAERLEAAVDQRVRRQ